MRMMNVSKYLFSMSLYMAQRNAHHARPTSVPSSHSEQQRVCWAQPCGQHSSGYFTNTTFTYQHVSHRTNWDRRRHEKDRIVILLNKSNRRAHSSAKADPKSRSVLLPKLNKDFLVQRHICGNIFRKKTYYQFSRDTSQSVKKYPHLQCWKISFKNS